MTGFIDPPSTLAPLKDWEDFLKSMRTWPEKSRDVLWREAVKQAEDVIARKRKAPVARAAN